MKYKVDIQNVSTHSNIPDRFTLQRWTDAALANKSEPTELTIRIVDEEESQSLNHNYRQKNYPTNVLSFPADIPDDIELDVALLGDLVICAPVVEREAREQKKNLNAHWAHMVVHGILHLQGYDHIEEQDATVMENLEIAILDKLGFANPYGEE